MGPILDLEPPPLAAVASVRAFAYREAQGERCTIPLSEGHACLPGVRDGAHDRGSVQPGTHQCQLQSLQMRLSCKGGGPHTDDSVDLGPARMEKEDNSGRSRCMGPSLMVRLGTRNTS